MKIVLANSEKTAIRNVLGLIGISMKDASVAITSVTKTDSEMTIDTNPAYTVEFCNLVMTIAPMLKGLYHQAMGVFSVLDTLGTALDVKWAKKPEVTE